MDRTELIPCAKCDFEDYSDCMVRHEGQWLCEDCYDGDRQADYWEEVLITLLRELPPVYSMEGTPIHQQAATLRITTPNGWDYYPVEFDGTETCFGYVVGFESEWGYFSIEEMARVGGLRWETLDNVNIYEDVAKREEKAA